MCVCVFFCVETVHEVCARQIVKMLESRVDVEELDGYLQECEARIDHETAREIFLESLFWAGRDSISTQLVFFERYIFYTCSWSFFSKQFV